LTQLAVHLSAKVLFQSKTSHQHPIKITSKFISLENTL